MGKRGLHANDRGFHGGGYKQSVAAFDAEQSASSDVPIDRCPLAVFLVYECLWGLMPTWKVQLIAEMAIDAGAKHPDLDRLAKLGSGGVHKNNMWRDLFARYSFSQAFKFAKGLVSTPLLCGMEITPDCDVDFLFPHAVFSFIFESHPVEFTRRFLGGAAHNVARFWNAMTSHPSFPTHPMHTHPRFDFHEKGVPFSVHGDGVTCIACGKVNSKNVECISWAPLLCGPAFSWMSNILIVLLWKFSVVKEGPLQTMDVVWKHVAWSLYWLYQGLWPDRGADGVLYTEDDGWKFHKRLTQLAGGFFGVFWVKRMDLDWSTDQMQLGNHRANSSCCGLCDANSTTRKWTDCRMGSATWLGTVWDNGTHAEAHPNRHRLLRHVPGAGVTCFVPDWLHTKHIGCDAYFLGGILQYMLAFMGLPGSPADILKMIWRDMLDAYAELKLYKNRLYSLTFTMVQSEAAKLPCLKARGAQVKSAVPALKIVFAKYADAGNEQHNDILTALGYTREIDTILDGNITEYVLPPLDAARLQECCWRFCQYMTKLVKYFHPRDMNVFHYTLKMHYLIHFGMVASYMNPALGSCHSGEDLMKIVKRLISQSAVGSKPAPALKKAMGRYAAGLELDLCGLDKVFR